MFKHRTGSGFRSLKFHMCMYLHAYEQQNFCFIQHWYENRGKSYQTRLVTVRIPPGVDVMITIFSDFCQFSAKKLAFFSKTNVMIICFQNLALFWVKNANFFAKFFGEIFLNHNIGPRV
jgi:hypothetical protein